MIYNQNSDVIIVGGSYSGLSAAMALGRALRQVLVIDNGQPCNIQTPRSHNFLTRDGQIPKQISALARKQVEKYETIQFYDGLATNVRKKSRGFSVTTQSGENFNCSKLIFATGVRDLVPDIDGFSECWGISVIHCPYCHGYEVRNETTGIFGNGDAAFEFSKMIFNWTKDVAVFTNGKSTFSGEQSRKLKQHRIKIIEKEIDKLEHHKGYIENVIFKDGSKSSIKAMYAKIPFVQHTDLPKKLGCELTEQGFIKVDAFQKTTVHGIFACGDNCNFMRSISTSVAMGTLSGAAANKEMIEEAF